MELSSEACGNKQCVVGNASPPAIGGGYDNSRIVSIKGLRLSSDQFPVFFRVRGKVWCNGGEEFLVWHLGKNNSANGSRIPIAKIQR